MLAVFLVMSFAFENLDVYRLSLDFVEQTESLTKKIEGKASRALIDQLGRAALPSTSPKAMVVGISPTNATSSGLHGVQLLNACLS